MKTIKKTTTDIIKKVQQRQKKKLITVEEAQTIIENNSKRPISINLVQRYCREGRLVATKAGQHDWKIELDSALNLERSERKPKPENPKNNKELLLRNYILESLHCFNVSEIATQLICTIPTVMKIICGEKITNPDEYMTAAMQLYQQAKYNSKKTKA